MESGTKFSVLIVVVFILFFLSGLTGLLYEVVWTRLFGLVFGNTTLAISTVLSAFMLGLSSGSIVLGRVADRIKGHLKLYALLELGVGLAAIAIFLLQGILERLFATGYLYLQQTHFLFHLLQFVIAFLVMFPATFLMGGTLPVLSHVVVDEEKRLGSGIGKLYSINTLGAMVGCFVTGFVFLRVLGIQRTIYYAAGMNGFIVFMAYLFSRFRGSRVFVPEVKAPSFEGRFPGAVRLIFLVMALSGFVSLSYEVLWSRMLVFVMTNSVYAFTVMLTTFLCGIGVGSYFGGKWADRTRDLFGLLGWVECGIGVSALIAATVLTNLSGIHDSVFIVGPTTTWWEWNGIRFLEAFLVMFIPTFFMGASFPIASRIVVSRLGEMGSRLGSPAFCHPSGGGVGSFLTGSIIISFWGICTA